MTGWVFTVIVQTPQLIRAPGLENPDNWNVEGFDQANWDSSSLVADQVADELRKAAPAGTSIESTTTVSMLVRTPDKWWFDAFMESNPHIDLVMMHKTPEDPEDPFEELPDLYTYDKRGRIGNHG